jgi:hypothetical protein
MGLLDEIKNVLSRFAKTSGPKEATMSEKMTTEEVNEYMMKQCGFVPRMFKIINTVTPDPGRTTPLPLIPEGPLLIFMQVFSETGLFQRRLKS